MGNGPRVGVKKAVNDAGFPGYFHQILTIIVDNREERSTPREERRGLADRFLRQEEGCLGFQTPSPFGPRRPGPAGLGYVGAGETNWLAGSMNGTRNMEP